MKKSILTIALASMIILTHSALADFKSCEEAYAAQNYNLAANECLLPASQGHDVAQFNMGYMLITGNGITKNLKQAFDWFRKAAEQGHATAQYNLGVMYADSLGVPQDYAEAVKWYRKAAEQGHAAAQNNLGTLYKNGQGLKKNPVLAYMLFSLSAAQGGSKAETNRDEVVGDLSSAQLQEAKQLAANWKVGHPLPRAVMTLLDPDSQGNVCGWINLQGKVTLFPNVEAMEIFQSDVASAKSRNGLWGYVDPTGKWVVPPEYDNTYNASEGYAVVGRDGKRGYINLRQPKTPPQRWFDYANRVSQGVGGVEIDGKWGFFDPKSNAMAIDAKFDMDYFTYFTPDLRASVKVDGKYKFIDRHGAFIDGGPWEDLVDYSEGLSPVKRDGKWGFIDVAGKLVIPLKFEEGPGPFRDGLSRIYINGKHGFIDKTGEWVIPPRFRAARNFSSGRSFVSDETLQDYYLIDKYGKRLSKPIYNSAEQFNNGLAWVRTDDQRGLVDTQGRMVLQLQKIDIDDTFKINDRDVYEGKFSFCKANESKAVKAAPTVVPKPAASSDTNCRPKGLSIRCSSRCTNGDCEVTYENGCKIRVQVSPKFNPFINQWEFPSPGC